MALPSAPPAQFNFAQFLIAANNSRKDKTALIDDVGSLTYGQMADQIRACAAGLRKLGLKREERVLLLMQDSSDWVVSFLGALYAGVVPVAVNTLLTADDYAFMINNSRAQAALVSSALLGTLNTAIAQGTKSIKHVVVSRHEGDLPAPQMHFKDLLASASGPSLPAETHADEPAFWLFSSGSTGNPKGTVHTQGNLYWTAQLYGKGVLALTSNDVVFSAAKLFFAYGLGNALTFPLSVGASVVLMAERPTPQATFKRLVDHKPTVFYGAPTGYGGMLASPDLPTKDQVALRLCSSAGEALPDATRQLWKKASGIEMTDGIGGTEVIHIYISSAGAVVRAGSIGKVVPGYQAQIVDEDMQAVPPGVVGRLAVRGPTGCRYLDDPRQKDYVKEGWNLPGDTFVMDADGYFSYQARNDDMIISAGYNIAGPEVESALMQHPAVAECGVVGVSDIERGQVVMAFVVLKPGYTGSPALEKEIQEFVKQTIAPFKYPRRVMFCDAMPRTETGKLQRFKLRQQAMAFNSDK